MEFIIRSISSLDLQICRWAFVIKALHIIIMDINPELPRVIFFLILNATDAVILCVTIYCTVYLSYNVYRSVVIITFSFLLGLELNKD